MREETLFHLALEKPATERAAFLQQACAGDVELCRRVEALLHAHDNPGSFLGKPVPERLAGGGWTTNSDTASPSADGSDRLDFLEPPDKPGAVRRLGHYDILQVVGHGGMGIVLQAFDTKLRRVVAIKVMAPQIATGATARQRFIREAQAAAAVRNEHVIDIHAVDEANGLPYLVMEFIAGVSLQERLDRRGPMQVREILRIGMQTAAGLAAAHAQGLVHRDIKPANILLENGVERVKLTDFGLARAVDDAKLTQSGLIAGSPKYMSPEQAEGRAIDHRSDLFSLGSVLYTMCTGRSPFRANTTIAVLKRVCEETPRPIREINPDVPPWLVEIVARLHAKDPAERFQSASEVADLLGRHLAQLQQPPTDAMLPGLTVRQRRRRWPYVAAALAVLAVGISVMEMAGVTQLVPALFRVGAGPTGGQEAERRHSTMSSAETPQHHTEQPNVDPLVDPGELPVPQLAFKHRQVLSKCTCYHLTIANRDAFPDAFFQSSEGLPPIGSNKTASRTLIDLYDAKDDRRLGGFCIAGSASKVLDQLSISVEKGESPPKQVYAVFMDRKLKQKYRSSVVAVSDQPFVILTRGDRAERACDTLAEAVQRTTDGDTIEVRANGPFALEPMPITVRGSALCIRAGEGIRPVFIVRLPPNLGAGPEMLQSNSRLTLEGLDIRQTDAAPTQPLAIRKAIIHSHGPLFAANCRFVGSLQGKNALLYANVSDHWELRNCQLVGYDGFMPVYTTANRTVLRNNVIVATGKVLYLQYNSAVSADLELTQNTFVGTWPVRCQPVQQPNLAPNPMAEAPKLLRIEATGNLFDGRPDVLFCYFPVRSQKPVELLQQHISWTGSHNLFPTNGRLSIQNTVTDQPMVLSAGLPAWKEFWGSPEIGSVEGRPRYLGGEVLGALSKFPEQIIPEKLRLHPVSAGRGAGPGGKDLGADPDLVGPGPAYERWKQTRDYQNWLEITGQAN
jgi:serine/threonine protein kinase